MKAAYTRYGPARRSRVMGYLEGFFPSAWKVGFSVLTLGGLVYRSQVASGSPTIREAFSGVPGGSRAIRKQLRCAQESHFR
jgi:hypothetical protein